MFFAAKPNSYVTKQKADRCRISLKQPTRRLFFAALVATVTNWAERDDGGKLCVKRLLVAVIILLVFWLFSKFAGRVTYSQPLATHSTRTFNSESCILARTISDNSSA